MKRKHLSAWVASSAIVSFLISLMFSAIISSGATDIPPPVSGIEIVEYKDSIVQEAGTAKAYEVKVKNIGVLTLNDVRLGAEKIPEGWFSSDDVVDLEFEEVATLKYELTVPEGVSDLYWFPLVARGSYGVATVSDTAPVIVNVAAPEANVTTTTAPEAQLPLIPAPIISISENLTQLFDELKEMLKSKELEDYSEIVFSKFRAGVAYVRVTARAVLSDQLLLYKTIVVLLVVTLILATGRELIIG